jgi:hypothetical protein
VRFGLYEQALFLQIGDHAFARLEAVQIPVAGRCFIIGFRVDGEDIDLRKTVALADDVVVEIVRRRYLERAAASGST